MGSAKNEPSLIPLSDGEQRRAHDRLLKALRDTAQVDPVCRAALDSHEHGMQLADAVATAFTSSVQRLAEMQQALSRAIERGGVAAYMSVFVPRRAALARVQAGALCGWPDCSNGVMRRVATEQRLTAKRGWVPVCDVCTEKPEITQ